MFFENRHRRLTQVIPSHRQQQPMDLIQPCIGVRHGVLRLVKVRQSVTEKQVKIRIRALTNPVGHLLGFPTMVTRRRSQIPNEHRQSCHCFIRALNHIHHSGDTRIIMTEHHHVERQLVIDAGFEHTALRAISHALSMDRRHIQHMLLWVKHLGANFLQPSDDSRTEITIIPHI